MSERGKIVMAPGWSAHCLRFETGHPELKATINQLGYGSGADAMMVGERIVDDGYEWMAVMPCLRYRGESGWCATLSEAMEAVEKAVADLLPNFIGTADPPWPSRGEDFGRVFA